MLLHQVKLPHHKASAESSTVSLPLPEKVVISMAQHLGAPCTTTVKVGDKVKIGTGTQQYIGRSDRDNRCASHFGKKYAIGRDRKRRS